LVCLDVYREECSLALFFPQPEAGGDWLADLEAFSARFGEYQEQETRVLAVLPLETEELAANPRLARLPFLLLSDPENLARRAFCGLMAEHLVAPGDSLLFVLDRYHAPYAALVIGGNDPGGSFARKDIQDEILKWFEYIGVQCPE
jgi:hypothetical protein